MADEREMIIEQRNLLLSNLSAFYPNARSGESLFLIQLGIYPEYTRRYGLRDFAYLEAKGYVEKAVRAKRERPASLWSDAYWRLTAKGLEVAQKITEDPALEV